MVFWRVGVIGGMLCPAGVKDVFEGRPPKFEGGLAFQQIFLPLVHAHNTLLDVVQAALIDVWGHAQIAHA